MAHPDHVESAWNPGARIQKIPRICVNAVATRFAGDVLFQHGKLLGKIHHSNMDIGIDLHTLKREASGVATDIEQRFGAGGEDSGERLLERMVGVEMVETEPALADFRRE